MKLLTYLQQTYGLPRRAITDAIKEQRVFVDEKPVEGFSMILWYGQKLRAKIKDKIIDDTITEQSHQSELIIFHKPAGYVCSKHDKNNKTIYRVLGTQYKNYYYIGRLDKDSRGLLLLTNDPQTVHQYEHPRHKVEKEYIVTVKVRDQDFVQRLVDGTKDNRKKSDNTDNFLDTVKKLFMKWLLVDEDGKLAKKDNSQADVLKIVDLELMTWTEPICRQLGIHTWESEKTMIIRVILNEGKKRHIRRLWSSIWGEVLDLVRVRVGEISLWKLVEGESKKW